MGICLSAEQREQNQRSAHIDKMITDDASKIKKECKILLLGSGESGKSTIVKQMKIIHQNGYKQQELERFKSTVAMNIVDSTVDIALAMDKFKIIPENPKAKAYCEFLIRRPTYATKVRISSEPPYKAEAEPSNSRGEDAKMGLSAQWLEIVETVWSDPARIRLMDEQSSNFYIMDNAPYFFENIKRIAAPDYIPTEEDVLRSRQKTTGITETRFTIGQLQIHMFDVGGQRSERKKWIHCFEGVTSIIFCVGLSEYDQMLLEEANQNRMQESLVLFESIINSRWFLRTSFILFLNKIDLFKAKLKKIPLNKYFPEYDSGPDVSKAAKYILWKFTQANRAKLSVYPHLTQATDTSNIR